MDIISHKVISRDSWRPPRSVVLILLLTFQPIQINVFCYSRAAIMEVFVDAGSSGRFGVIVFPDITILGFKESIERKLFVPASQQHLMFGGRQLSNDRTLYSYLINNGCTVRCYWSSLKRVPGHEDVQHTSSQQLGNPQKPLVKSAHPKEGYPTMAPVPPRKSAAVSDLPFRKPVPNWQTTYTSSVPRVPAPAPMPIPIPAKQSHNRFKFIKDLPTSAPSTGTQYRNNRKVLMDLHISTPSTEEQDNNGFNVWEDPPTSTGSDESSLDLYGAMLPSRARSNLPTPSRFEKDMANSVAVSVLGDFMSTPTARMINELQGTVMRRVEWQAVKEVLRESLKARTDIGCLARLLEGKVVKE